jgi:uncharacterized membrane protein YjjP (DUF1212 family)
MRIGDTLLSSGMSANDAVVLMLRITKAYGLSRVHIDVTYTSMVATYYPAPGVVPVTAIRVTKRRDVDYTEVQGLDRLSTDIGKGMPLEQAVRAYERLIETPHPYPQWVATAGNAGVAAAVSLMFTTVWKVPLITFATGCVVDRVFALLDRYRVPAFFQQLAGAGIITLVAAGVSAAAAQGVAFFAGVDPTLVVVGGIIMLVAGMMIVGAAQDAIDQFYVTASARILEAGMQTAGIIVGILAALFLARYVGSPVAISADPVALGAVPWQYVGAVLTSMLFALSCYARPVTIALSGAMGFVGWAGYSFFIQAGGGEVWANALGALAAALVATLLIRRTTVPGFALVNAALLPLVPGLALYYGLIQIVGTTPGSGDLYTGGLTLLEAVSVALGIAAGASFGTFLGRPMADRLHQIGASARRSRKAPKS